MAAVALLLSACETFHYGDKIRYSCKVGSKI